MGNESKATANAFAALHGLGVVPHLKTLMLVAFVLLLLGLPGGDLTGFRIR